MLDFYAVLWYTIYNIWFNFKLSLYVSLGVWLKGVNLWLKTKTLLTRAMTATIYKC